MEMFLNFKTPWNVVEYLSSDERFAEKLRTSNNFESLGLGYPNITTTTAVKQSNMFS